MKDEKVSPGEAQGGDTSSTGRKTQSKGADDVEVQPVQDDGKAMIMTSEGPVSRAELKTVFRRAAWYSLVLALVVAIIGAPLSHLNRTCSWLTRLAFLSASSDVLLALRVQQRVLHILDGMYHVRMFLITQKCALTSCC